MAVIRAIGKRCLMKWLFEIGKIEDFQRGPKRVVIEGVPVAIFFIEGSFYAIEDTCSHEEESLAEGEIEDKTVTCPRHYSKFDLITGAPLTLPAVKPIRVFETIQKDGKVYVKW